MEEEKKPGTCAKGDECRKGEDGSCPCKDDAEKSGGTCCGGGCCS